MICAACQTDNPEGSRFCMECGTSLSSTAGSRPGSVGGPSTGPQQAPGAGPGQASGEAPTGAPGGHSAGGPGLVGDGVAPDTPPVPDPLSPPGSDPLAPLAGGGGGGAPLSSTAGAPPAPADPPASGPPAAGPPASEAGPPPTEPPAPGAPVGSTPSGPPRPDIPAVNPAVNPADPNGLGAVAAHLAQDRAGQVRTALVVAAALLARGERTESVCQGTIDGVPGVLVLSDQRLLVVNQRDWTPVAVSFTVDDALDINGTEEGGVATVVVAGSGQRVQMDQITDRPPAYDLVARARARTGR